LTRAWSRRLLAPVDVASLAAFRVLFGAVLFVAALRFLGRGWTRTLYLDPPYHFPWPGLGFVRPWPAPLMHAHVWLLAAAALGLAVGWKPRSCAALYTLLSLYVELLDRALFLNHHYLVTLLAALLALVPAGNAFTVAPGPPRPQQIPGWVLAVMRLQVGVVYLYAGIAKLNGDWLLRAQPLRMWLAAHADWPLVGPGLAQPATAFAASWLGLLFDLTIVPLLLWKRTRGPAFGAVVLFHVATGLLFPVGMFPWVMIAGATLFWAPDWPRRRFALAAPPVAVTAPPRPISVVLVAHAVLQVLLPLRAYAGAQSCRWSGEGFDLSWNVMIAEKAGVVALQAVDLANGTTWPIDLTELTPLQRQAMAQDPALIQAYARQVAAELWRRHRRRFAIHADAHLSLNGRAPRPLLDARIDLAAPDATATILPLD
jgi:vitamin K-dependent gamma-carboxylase